MFETVKAADGHAFDCWMPPAPGAARGGLVILQEIFGVTGQLKAVGDRYARQGYAVAIPALFDRQRRGAVIGFDDAAQGRDLMLATNPAQAMLDIDATVAALRARGLLVAVMGFCWGGGLVLRAAQGPGVACGVSFYGTRLGQYLDPPLRVPVQGHFGRHDDHTPPEVLAALTAAQPLVEVHLYDAGHAFANEARAAHVPQAAELAHQRTEAFLARHLG